MRTYRLTRFSMLHWAMVFALTVMFSVRAQAWYPIVTTDSQLPDGYVGRPYSVTLEATGGVEPYTWTWLEGCLPGGVSLKSTTGVISGVPRGAATCNLAVRVTGADGAYGNLTYFSLRAPNKTLLG